MAHEELKQRQSVMWGKGAYQRITETLADIHDAVIERLQPQPDDRWLDLACGTGAVAERVAGRVSEVVGIDLAPDLIAEAKQRAEERGLDIDYRVGDCENLEVEDGSFDVVSSTLGIMFAPDHEASARELARVTKPGGRIGLANWKPGPGIQELFQLMSPYQPAKPPSSPFDWGDESRVRDLLGDTFELTFETRESPFTAASGEEYWTLFSTAYGPTKTLAESLDGDRREQLHREWVEHFDSRYRTNGQMVHPRPYLLIVGTRR